MYKYYISISAKSTIRSKNNLLIQMCAKVLVQSIHPFAVANAGYALKKYFFRNFSNAEHTELYEFFLVGLILLTKLEIHIGSGRPTIMYF